MGAHFPELVRRPHATPTTGGRGAPIQRAVTSSARVPAAGPLPLPRQARGLPPPSGIASRC